MFQTLSGTPEFVILFLSDTSNNKLLVYSNTLTGVPEAENTPSNTTTIILSDETVLVGYGFKYPNPAYSATVLRVGLL